MKFDNKREFINRLLKYRLHATFEDYQYRFVLERNINFGDSELTQKINAVLNAWDEVQSYIKSRIEK